MNIAGSVAIVTGANRGLGRHFAEQLLLRGASKVYAAARRPDSIDLPGVVPIRIDLTDASSIEAAADRARDVTLLINNAGITTHGGFLTDPAPDRHAEMGTNYFGTLAVTLALAPHLIANAPAAVLNVLSVLSWLHPPYFGTYAASKAALWAQTDTIRDELAPHGVAVTALHVGYMDTDMVASIDAPKSDPAAIAALALDGVQDGVVEVLADDLTRTVKADLATNRGTVAVSMRD